MTILEGLWSSDATFVVSLTLGGWTRPLCTVLLTCSSNGVQLEVIVDVK